MASFQAKIGWKRLRKRENKTVDSFRTYPNRNRKFQKSSKKIKKIKKHLHGFTIMALFQSKIGRKIMRQRENKNYRPLSSLPDT